MSYTPTRFHRSYGENQSQANDVMENKDSMGKLSPHMKSLHLSQPELSLPSRSIKVELSSPRSRKFFRSKSGKEKELTRHEKLEQVAKASINVENSCAQLQASCRCILDSTYEAIACCI